MNLRKIQIYMSYTFVKRIEIVRNVEGRFEEAVIAYLFIVNLLPILIVPILWCEAKKVANILNEWSDFEVCKNYGIVCTHSSSSMHTQCHWNYEREHDDDDDEIANLSLSLCLSSHHLDDLL